MTKTIFITGANRSIGLEFARQYASEGFRVIATCRAPDQASELLALADQYSNLIIEKLDIGNSENIIEITHKYQNQAIDKLINNAGVLNREQASILDFDSSSIQKIFDINFYGTLELTSKLIPNILNSTDKHILTLTSKVSSMADNRGGKNFGYRCSKIALNMAMKNIALEFYEQGLRVMLLHPGWVQTPMGGPNALIDTQASVKGMREIVSQHIDNSLCDFYEFNGKIVPW